MTNILCMYPQNGNKNGVIWYRMSQFADIATSHGMANVFYLNLSGDVKETQKLLSSADIYYFRLSDSFAFDMFDIIMNAKTPKPMVLDLDDNYDVVDPLSDMYQVYGTEDIQLASGEWLWKTGVNGFDKKKNKERLERFHKLMERMTAITVTTFELRNYALQYNPAVTVIPNGINHNLFPPIKVQKPRDEIRILWSGGSSHYPDLAEIVEPLKEVMRENKNIHFYMLGMPFKGIVKHLPEDRIHTAGWVSADGHGYRLACMGADIMIGPLKDMEFNKYKSSIKYYEAGALKIPFIARNMPPYSDDIKDQENGILYNDPAHFRSCLNDLINDPIKRIKIGQSAYNYVMNSRSIFDITEDWVKFLSDISIVYKNGENSIKKLESKEWEM